MANQTVPFFMPKRLKAAAVAALPIIIFLFLRHLPTRADREFRAKVGEVVQVDVVWIKPSVVKEDNGNGSQELKEESLFTFYRGSKDLTRLMQSIRLSNPDQEQSGQPQTSKPYKPVTSQWRNDPDGYLQFTFHSTTPYPALWDFYLHHGHFVAPGHHELSFHWPPKWGYDGAPLQGSTKAYLKELLKPYHIPDEVIDGKR